jgi:hypothetical protein
MSTLKYIQILQEGKKGDAKGAPCLFAFLTMLTMAKRDKNFVNKQSNTAVRDKLGNGESPLPADFTNKRKRDSSDEGNGRLAAKVDMSSTAASMLINFIMNSKKKGQVIVVTLLLKCIHYYHAYLCVYMPTCIFAYGYLCV